jgi:hypothetical protein
MSTTAITPTAQSSGKLPPNQAAFDQALQTAMAGRTLQSKADGSGSSGTGVDIESGVASAAVASAATVNWAPVFNAIVNGGAGALSALGTFAMTAGSAAVSATQTGAAYVMGGAQAAGTYGSTVALPLAQQFLTAAGNIAVVGSIAPVLSVAQGTTSWEQAVGGAAAGLVHAALGAYFTNANLKTGAAVAGGLLATLNLGIAPPDMGTAGNPLSFKAYLKQQGGSVGVLAGFALRYTGPGLLALGAGAAAQALSNSILGNNLPANLPPDSDPFPGVSAANATAGGGSGRGLLGTALSNSEKAGLNGAANQVWQQWMANPSMKALVTQMVQTPGGATTVMQQLYQSAGAAYANQQATATLQSFASSNPAAYQAYENYVGAANGPAQTLEEADQNIQSETQSAQDLISTELTTYLGTNPNGSLSDFFAQLPPQVTAQLNAYGQEIAINQTIANKSIFTMQTAFQTFSNTGTAPTSSQLAVDVAPNSYNSTGPSGPVTTPATQVPGPTTTSQLFPDQTGPSYGEIVAATAATGAALGAAAGTVGFAGGPVGALTVTIGAGVGALGGAVVGAAEVALLAAAGWSTSKQP